MSFINIILLSRPRFWLYTLGPYIIGIAAGNNLQALSDIKVWYGFFYFLFPANLLIYCVNDYFDRQLDLGNPKKHIQETYMKARDAGLYSRFIVFSLLLSLPLLFIDAIITTAMLVFLLVGIFYSAPPFRFKTKVFLDSFSNFFYIIPGAIGYLLVSGNLPNLGALVAGSLWAMAMHLFSAIVDISADKKAGITTTATKLGYRNSLLLASAVWLVSIIPGILYSPVLLLGFVYPVLPLFIVGRLSTINTVYWMFPWINTFLGFILFCAVVYEL